MKKARPRLPEPRVNEVERGDSRNTDFKASGCEFRDTKLPEPFPEFPPSREGQGGAEGTEEAREGRASGFWPRETRHYKALAPLSVPPGPSVMPAGPPLSFPPGPLCHARRAPSVMPAGPPLSCPPVFSGNPVSFSSVPSFVWPCMGKTMDSRLKTSGMTEED